MYNELRKFIDNQKADTPCEKVVGSKTSVARYSRFWAQEQDSLMVLASGTLHEFITENNPTHDELKAFKKGQAVIALFFARCAKEIEDRLKQENQG